MTRERTVRQIRPQPSFLVFTIGSMEFCGVVVWVERSDATKLTLHGCARWLVSFNPFGNSNTDWLAKMIYTAGHLCFPFRVSFWVVGQSEIFSFPLSRGLMNMLF